MESFEREARRDGFRLVAGVDEAGRGPLAGPVVAAAVILPFPPGVSGVRDSKTLSPRRREELLFHIYGSAVAVGVGIVWPSEIDDTNIHRASLRAMELSVGSLNPRPDLLLIDGPFTIDSPLEQKPLVSGDRLSVSIAAASIVAKTVRDRIMAAYHRIYPDYNFARNKGYPTREHLSRIEAIGSSPIHRRSFKGVETRRTCRSS